MPLSKLLVTLSQLSQSVGYLFHPIKTSHKPRLGASGPVLVNDALLGRLVQGTDSELSLLPGFLGLSLSDKYSGLLDKGPSPGTKNLVALSLPSRAPDLLYS